MIYFFVALKFDLAFGEGPHKVILSPLSVCQSGDVHNPFSLVLPLSQARDIRKRYAMEIFQSHRAINSEIRGASAEEQKQAIKETECIWCWRVNGGTHGDAHQCQRLDHRHDFIRRKRIQPRRGLIQEQHPRICDQSYTDVDPLGLTTRDASSQLTPNQHVSAGIQRQHTEELLHCIHLALLRLGDRLLEICRVQQHLFHCQDWQQCVSLFHIARVTTEEVARRLLPSKFDITANLSHRLPAGQNVKEGRLS
mmetsp:Transcript_2128/g.4379  ORF Transcript_2128/g.4379 Transcript_2128/m.4379 type:complete len:252 (+) Transcript_2128:2680-3435(+)